MNSVKTNFLALFIILFLGQSLIAMEKQNNSKLIGYINSEFECCVCLEEINPDQSDNIIVLNCNHYICNDCCEDWKERANTCPQCRAPIVRAYRTFNDRLVQEKFNNARNQVIELQEKLQQEQRNGLELARLFRQMALENNEQGKTKEMSKPKQLTAILYEAIRNDSPEEIRCAVEAGADVNGKIVYRSPLLLSIIYKKNNALNELLKLNAKFNDNPANIKRIIELDGRPEIIELYKQYTNQTKKNVDIVRHAKNEQQEKGTAKQIHTSNQNCIIS